MGPACTYGPLRVVARGQRDSCDCCRHGGDDGQKIESTAREIYYHYSRLNRAAGKERDAVYMLLRIREAMAAKEAGRFETALEVWSSRSFQWRQC